MEDSERTPGFNIRSFLRPRPLPILGALLASLVLAGCGDRQSALDPQGPAASTIALSWWIMLSIAAITFSIVMGLVLWAVFRRQTGDPDEISPAQPDEDSRFILTWGTVVPGLVLILFAGFIIYTEVALADDDDNPAERIEIIGHQWWWEVRYPDRDIITANEIHIPAGEPVDITVTTADVIHSFWVPQLHGKIDLIPGITNEIQLEADDPGTYRGQCAEYCGLQHAHMAFTVVADDSDDYAAWVDQQQQVPANPEDQDLIAGRQVFLGSACVYCHRIAGTNASGEIGPDLTHIASRETLGAGTIENSRGNLAAWIIDSQHFKPGNKMPPMDLSGPELQQLIDYLESLE
ncbi:MAG: cytochrome c oxidase subunit II [Thermomicrobiales bacterium]